MTISSNFIIWSHSPEKTQMHHLVYRWAHCTIRCTIGSVYTQYVAYIYIYIQFAPYGENLDPHFLVQPPLTPNQFLISGAKNWQPILTSGICFGWYMVHGAYIAAFGSYGAVHTLWHLVCRDAADVIWDVICVNNKAYHDVDFCHRDKDALFLLFVSTTEQILM